MYDITCPYCGHENFPWEVEGGINKYMPHICEGCSKFYYIFQRSWFDPVYDNHNVEVRRRGWLIEMKRKEKVEVIGRYDDGKRKADIYAPLWDIYEDFGGEKEVAELLRNIIKRGERL
jgi:hypothetical protein